MLKYAGDYTSRAMILVLASSGVRVGGLIDLNWDDVAEVYRVDDKLTMDPDIGEGEIACAMLDVYRGSKYHYYTFISLEAYEALQEHKRVWEKLKNRPTQDGDAVFMTQTGIPKRTSHVLVRKRLTRIADKAGVRGGKKGKRFNVPIIQGFRRFWTKTCKDARTNDSRVASLIQIEYMVGHQGLVALDKNYYKTEAIELAAGYVELMLDLTIGHDTKMKQTTKRLSANIRELESERDSAVADLKKKVADLERQNKEIKAERDSVTSADTKIVSDLARRLHEQDEAIKEMKKDHVAEMKDLRADYDNRPLNVNRIIDALLHSPRAGEVMDVIQERVSASGKENGADNNSRRDKQSTTD